MNSNEPSQTPSITPEFFKKKMDELQENHEGMGGENHVYAEEIVCELLTSLGYGAGVATYKRLFRNY